MSLRIDEPARCTSDQSTHTRAGNHADGNSLLLQSLENTDMGNTPKTTATKCQSYLLFCLISHIRNQRWLRISLGRPM